MSDFNETRIFRHIFEKYYNIKFNEHCPVAAELSHADRQHDVAHTRFSQSCEQAKKCNVYFLQRVC
jgi:hypothetical protein